MTSKETGIEKMTLEEIKKLAGKKVKQDVWEWINGGTETEFTLQRNRSALERILLKLRVLVGRPICWGLATAGAEGVAKVLQMMTDELCRAMMLTNVPDASNVPRDCLVLT